jgi:hypothetical protein
MIKSTKFKETKKNKIKHGSASQSNQLGINFWEKRGKKEKI